MTMWDSSDPLGDLIAAALPLMPPKVTPSVLQERGRAWMIALPNERRQIVCHPDDVERIREALDTLTDST